MHGDVHELNTISVLEILYVIFWLKLPYMQERGTAHCLSGAFIYSARSSIVLPYESTPCDDSVVELRN